jgi:hypothetical protein
VNNIKIQVSIIPPDEKKSRSITKIKFKALSEATDDEAFSKAQDCSCAAVI